MCEVRRATCPQRTNECPQPLYLCIVRRLHLVQLRPQLATVALRRLQLLLQVVSGQAALLQQAAHCCIHQR